MNCLLFELLKRNKDYKKDLEKEFSKVLLRGNLVSINEGLKIARKYIQEGIKFIFNGNNWHANSDFGIPIERVDFSGLVGEPMSTAMAILYSSMIAGGATMGASALSKGKGGDSDFGYDLPDYQLDPYYESSQEELSEFGSGLLKGEPSEYYKPIGEVGGQMFEDMLAKGKRDISKTVTEDFARRNVRGARASNVIGKQVGDYSTQARYQDLMRALEGRGFLMGKGLSTTAGVRDAALKQTGLRSSYDINKGNLALGYAGLAAKTGEQESGAWSDLISGTIGAGANIYGASQLGKVDTKVNRDPTGGYYPGGYSGMGGY